MYLGRVGLFFLNFFPHLVFTSQSMPIWLPLHASVKIVPTKVTNGLSIIQSKLLFHFLSHWTPQQHSTFLTFFVSSNTLSASLLNKNCTRGFIYTVAILILQNWLSLLNPFIKCPCSYELDKAPQLFSAFNLQPSLY